MKYFKYQKANNNMMRNYMTDPPHTHTLSKHSILRNGILCKELGSEEAQAQRAWSCVL